MRKVRKRVRGEKEKETNRERRKRVVECIIEEENRQNRVLDVSRVSVLYCRK